MLIATEVPKRPQKAVVDGKPTYTSASSLQTADPNTSGGCPRKWWFQKVMGLKSPPTKSQAIGTETHGLIEHYLKTGELTLNPIAMAGKHLIPSPDPSFLIEHRIWNQQLKPAGIPIEGYIDLVRPPRVEDRNNYNVEVIDWKTTSNIKYAKTGAELPETIQMGIYAKWAMDYYDVELVRLSHVYFQTRGRPQAKKSSIIVTADKIIRKWESIETVAGTLYEFAAETDVNKVPQNRDSCEAFGGCPFYSNCPRTAAEIFDMSLINEDEKVEANPAFVAAWGTIVQSGRGIPSIGGRVAKLVASFAGGSEEFQPGFGELAGLPTISDVETIKVLADELRQEATVAVEEPEAPEVLPPDAPESDPAQAALPVMKDVPEGVASLAEAKKMKKGDLLEAYETCFEALMSRVDLGVDIVMPEAMQGAPRPVSVDFANRVDAAVRADTIYVNCVPPTPCERLEPYIFNITNSMAESAKDPDIRMSKKDALSFGKWRGALASAVKESPPEGSFTVTCKGDEFAEVVVQALEGTHQIVRGF